MVGSSKQEKLPRPTLEEMESAPTDVEEEKGSQLEPEKSKSSGKTEYQHLLEVYHGCLEALNKLKEEENQPKISSKKVARLNEELAAKSEELQQLAGSVKESLETQEESDQKIQTATLVLYAEVLICSVEFNQLRQSDLQPLSEKVKELTKEVKTLQKKAGKFSGQLDVAVCSLQNLTKDLEMLGGLPCLLSQVCR